VQAGAWYVKFTDRFFGSPEAIKNIGEPATVVEKS